MKDEAVEAIPNDQVVGDVPPDDRPPSAGTPTYWVPVDTLLAADSPRLGGEDAEHVRMLAESGARLPPILVHRQTMRIIDGMHRLGAARLRGERRIEVTFFDGSTQAAFILAVKTNITHGRPLSLADRTVAAERIMTFHPTWSDRAIAAAAGLGARNVAELRKRMQAAGSVAPDCGARVGRDGRTRPLDNAEGRLRASEVIRNRPNASVREIARTAGVSPTTALDVRKRLQRGDDPVPAVRPRRPAARANRSPASALPMQRRAGEPALDAMLRGLQRDPSLRFSESGRTLLRWVMSRVIRPDEWREMSGLVPSHCTYIMADVARRCADEWQRLAADLQRQADQVA